MPRAARSEVAALLQEARAVELLAEEADVLPDKLQAYWELSADLITLVTDIEQLRTARPDAPAEDPEIFLLRQRLRAITSRLVELSVG